MYNLSPVPLQYIVPPVFCSPSSRPFVCVRRCAPSAHVFPLSLFSPSPPTFPFKLVGRQLEITTDLDCICEGHQNSGFVLVISKIVWAMFSVPRSIRVVQSLCGLPRGKRSYFGHLCVWFSGPERADHTRTDTRGFGLVVLFHCSFLVCIYF
jgi:hypothetical protein